MAENRPLTPKEQKVIAAFDQVRPGLGAITESNIHNNDKTGWAEIIADTPEEELILKGNSNNAQQ